MPAVAGLPANICAASAWPSPDGTCSVPLAVFMDGQLSPGDRRNTRSAPRDNRGRTGFGLLTDALPGDADAGGSFPTASRHHGDQSQQPLQLNLGSLRSAMSLTLHTHHASRIWHGRAPPRAARDRRPERLHRVNEQDEARRRAGRPVLGLGCCASRTSSTRPRPRCRRCASRWIQALADVPPALTLGENLNVQPVKLPLFVNAQLGFGRLSAGRLRRPGAQTDPRPPHRADRPQHAWNAGSTTARTRCAACSRWPAVPLLGATRDDFASKNAVARAALEKFGELPQDVLEGTRRSRFAPPIARRAGNSPAPDAAPVAGAADADGRRSRTAGRRGDDEHRLPSSQPRFQALEQADFQRLEHAPT